MPANNEPTATHTPGPWSLSEADPFLIEKDVPGLADGYDSYVVAKAQVHSLILPNEAESNARLIAAAPGMKAEIERLRADKAELLAALKIADSWMPCIEQQYIGGKQYEADRDVMEAAIKNAEERK